VEHSDQGKDFTGFGNGEGAMQVMPGSQEQQDLAPSESAGSLVQVSAEGSISSLAERSAEPAKGTSLAQVSNDEVSKKVSLPSMVRGHRMQSSAALF
jgi:hypothetical protein